MAVVVLIGSDPALLEGLSQTLAAAGHRPRIAASMADAVERMAGELPLVVVVERPLAADGLRLPLAAGGAVLLFRTDSGSAPGGLPSSVQRLTLAELTLPLERHRLVALVQRVEERAEESGRGRRPTPPEPRAL